MIDVNPLDLELTSEGIVTGATAGEPEQFSATIANQDGVRVGVWRCEPGEFPWSWENAEMFHVIEGAGTITDEDGREHEVAPGKVFFMPAGSSAKWKVTKTIRKSWVVANPEQ
ncbi:cupin domain-containing protein [Mycolicibacterium goodii]|uniref:DUF861 domain-containing protein n=1 Tax=Mycolicibacterium goodii TaxID=134601 RepID=A0ABS6HYE8_MYCGD|nr:cupin domain-containing protein [Mycolicibacterium goodii]MBU8827689.1 DUF861 domain-containing protein [Mycolicibacterium goodii]MBU8841490.1 DUF861 domain-containing protein [Mycolicibacterium goodii]